MPKVYLSREAERLIKDRVYTIYSKWIGSVDAKPGDWVEIYNWRGKLIGLGFYEGIGAIGLRVLRYCLDEEEEYFEPEYLLENYIIRALKRRLKIVDEWDSYRLINADGDLIPGLIVDVYRDIAVIQSSSIGIDKYLTWISEFIVKEGIADRVYIRNDHRGRREAGLPIYKEWLIGNGDTRVKIREDEASFYVDVCNGQKTGFFLDQRLNRLTVKKFAFGSVLDLFCYTGGFGIHCALSDAEFVVLVDESGYAVYEAKNNVYENNVCGKVSIIQSKVEYFLDKMLREEVSFDVIICDPPAFIQSREYYEKGLSSYKRLYSSVMKIVSNGGLIFASSCSYFLDKDTFKSLLSNIAHEIGVEIVFLGDVYGLPPDHVYRPSDRELNYLKAYLFRVEKL